MFRATIFRAGASACYLMLGGFVADGSLRAQSPTTAAIAGRVVDERGDGLPGADVVVTNRATGISVRGTARADGRYLVGGLEVGGPYSVTVRRIGSPANTQTGFFLSLGQQLWVDATLGQQAIALPGVETRARRSGLFSRAHKGAQSLLSDSTIHQVPTINRDLYDLVRLVPQMSTWFASTASGANPRVNSIRIDGVTDQVPSSNLAAGALYGGKVIPLDAVKEYQVLLSPYDVRSGGFAGATINVATRSGTNDFHGTAFAFGTNEQLGPNVPLIRNTRYEKEQLGFSVGGPVVRDRLHFFLASEVQQRAIPAMGPSVEEAMSNTAAVPVRPTDIARFQQLLLTRGLDGGSAGPVSNPNPSSSVFLRLDAPIPGWNSRVSVRGSRAHADSSIFGRPTMLAPTNCPGSACFPLSSLRHSRWMDKQSGTVQLMTNFASGAYNEAVIGYTGTVSGFQPAVRQPLILVTVPSTSGGPAVLQSGTHEIATGQRNAGQGTELSDNFSLVAGSHAVTLGASALLLAMRAFQLRGAYGVWEFASLDSLAAGTASRYRVTRDTGSVNAVSGGQFGVYVGDEWTASPRLSINLGIRADVPVLRAQPPYIPTVDSIFHLRTDAVPSGQVHWSPRFGFNYDLTSEDGAAAQLRGGVGVFVGRPPLFWLFGGFASYGLATRTLQCGSLPSDGGAPPAFDVSYSNPPLACARGETFGMATTGEIDALDRGLRLPRSTRASLALDHQLPFGLVATVEGMYTRSSRAMFFSGINLREPTRADRDGRTMFGTISAAGLASPSRVASQLGDVIVVDDRAASRAYDLTAELRKVGRIADVQAALSYGRTRDVQSSRPLSSLLIDNWRFGRPVAGRQDDLTLGVSDYDQPVRVRASGTIHSPWQRYRTDVSFSYVGGSGFPFTYVAGGTQGRGDLNADGAVGNDPIYIPRTAFDTSEVRFGGAAAEVTTQQTAFDGFIDGERCLRQQRGRIMGRNSCRSPWMHLTNLAFRQTLSTPNTQSIAFEVQVFNVLNLLNPRWGRVQLPGGVAPITTSQLPLLAQVGETAGPAGQPIYRFDSLAPRYSSENFDTYYQIQVALRYSF